MIENLSLKSFKRFKSAGFAIKPLTVLCGTNGAGKTSLIHSMLLAKEAATRTDNVVELNGPFGLSLGHFRDVLNHSCEGSFEITLTDSNSQLEKWIFSGSETDLFARTTVRRKPARKKPSIFMKEPGGFQYLCAERIGPRLSQNSSALPNEMLVVGSSGEYSAQVLYSRGGLKIDDARAFSISEELPSLLKVQSEQWLSYITRPIQVDTDSHSSANQFSLKFRYEADWVKPTNTGFGVTYAFPIILATLSAPKGAILIVENPEAHLHPQGQSRIGIFIAKMAGAGLKIIVETHSDHILNGIRRAIAENKYIPSSDVIFHHFNDELIDYHHPLTISESGGVSSWPAKFFDQYPIDVEALSTFRRRR